MSELDLAAHFFAGFRIRLMFGIDALPEAAAQVDAFTVEAEALILVGEFTQSDTLSGFSDDFAVQ